MAATHHERVGKAMDILAGQAPLAASPWSVPEENGISGSMELVGIGAVAGIYSLVASLRRRPLCGRLRVPRAVPFQADRPDVLPDPNGTDSPHPLSRSLS